ncbi:deoxyhypusine synthase [Candidatus Micrarchaeota archaeon]|nr:deoxyhypusine synthase [Candidatus Micrarchaeota archaeon]
MKPITDYTLPSSLSGLASSMLASGGFGAKHLGQAVQTLEAMNKDKQCTRILSFPADVCSTGFRGVLAEYVRKGLCDAIITTCGTLDHDLARGWGGDYMHGAFGMDDAALHRKKVYRLGNVLIPQAHYGGVLEKRMRPILSRLEKQKRDWSPHELCAAFGKEATKDRHSILAAAAKRRVPVFVPGITDGAFGSILLFNSGIRLDVLGDERKLADLIFDSKRLGALMLGGGISKHHTIWWAQFKGGLDYAVYVTTASQYDGSLSGARLEEAVSWGKVKEKAKYVTVDGDATIVVPLILGALYERLGGKRG